MAREAPTDDDKRPSIELVLSGLARGTDMLDLAAELLPLHPKNDTFPGEVFLSLAVDALEVGSFSRDEPLDFEGLHDRHLPEVPLRGRNDHRKSFYALMTPPALRGGVAPDLFGEIQWWGTDDYWQFALFALVVYVRAAAERLEVPVADVCRMLAERHGIAQTDH
jgi:hypothetical protein